VLLWPLPQARPAKVPPQGAALASAFCWAAALSPLCLSEVLKARALSPRRVCPRVVRACLCGKFLCRWGSKVRAAAGSLCLRRLLAAGTTTRSGLHGRCLFPAGTPTRPPLLVWWLLPPRPATRAPFLYRSLGRSARASEWLGFVCWFCCAWRVGCSCGCSLLCVWPLSFFAVWAGAGRFCHGLLAGFVVPGVLFLFCCGVVFGWCAQSAGRCPSPSCGEGVLLCTAGLRACFLRRQGCIFFWRCLCVACCLRDIEGLRAERVHTCACIWS